MPTFYSIRKTLKTNTTYVMEKDRYFVIERIGTDVNGKVTVKVDGIPVAELHSTITPMAKTASNLFGPLELNDLYIVVPPERQLYLESSTSGNVAVYGKLVILAPGETVPTEHMTRYNAYDKRKLALLDVSYTVGSSFAADGEANIVDINPPTIEDWMFNRRVGISISGLSTTLTYGMLAVKFYFDGKALDLLLNTAGPHGIDVIHLPLPPTNSVNYEPFSFKEMNMLVPGGHTLSVILRNISGSTLTAASGQNIVARLMAIYERTIKG